MVGHRRGVLERAAILKIGVWLGDRTWFRPHQARTLEADGLAAFGIALALWRRGESAQVNWLHELVVRSARSPDLPGLDRSLFIAAAHLIEAPEHQDAIAMLPEIRLAVTRLGLGVVDDACYNESWQRIFHFTGGPEVGPEAALLLRGLDVVTERNLPARLGRLDHRDVLHVLQGVQRSFLRWIWEDAPRKRKSALARWEIETNITSRTFSGLC